MVIALLVGDLYILNSVEIPLGDILKVIIMAVAILVALVSTFLFPVLSKFDNTIPRTIKNACVISILQLPKTLLMFVLNWFPWVLLVLSAQMVPVTFLLGFAIPAYLSAFLYNKFFKKLEMQIMEANGIDTSAQDVGEEDEHIFHDAPFGTE